MKKNLILVIGLMLAITASVIGFMLQQGQSQPFNSAEIHNRDTRPTVTSLTGTKRPAFTLQDKDGIQRNVDEWNNKVLVINFWATWCPPCREEIPAFIKLQEKFADQGLQFVGIALQTAEEVQDFINEFGINYPVLVGLEPVIQVAEQYGNRNGVLPYTVIVDRQQNISYIKQGPRQIEEAEAVIKTVL